jgi:hypothetical protein
MENDKEGIENSHQLKMNTTLKGYYYFFKTLQIEKRLIIPNWKFFL